MCNFGALIGGSVVATIWLDKMSGAPGCQTFFPVIFYVRSRTAKIENMKNNSTTVGLDYENGRVTTLFRKVFLPTLLGMIFNALITIIDGIFVGRGVGPQGIAAVNIIAPLFMVTTGIGLMFGIGSSVIAGIALASKDFARANRCISAAFAFSTALIGILVIGGAIFTEKIAYLLGSTQLLMDKATDYLLYLLIGLIPLMWQSIGMMVIRLDGSPKYAMLCNAIPAILNIILDWWFVFPLGMGVKGAALATSIACIVGGIMAISYFRLSNMLRFTYRMTGFASIIRKEMMIGSSAFITEIAMSVMMFTGNVVFIRAFGENGVAAYSIACYLFPLIFMINNAVAQSAQPIISVNYGAGNNMRVKEALKVSLRVAALCGLTATLGIGIGARPIVSLFIATDSPAAMIAIVGLPLYATSAIFFALNIAFIGYYQSVGKSVMALILTLLRGVVFLVPMFFLLAHLFPQWGIWAAIPASELLTFAITIMSFRRIRTDIPAS